MDKLTLNSEQVRYMSSRSNTKCNMDTRWRLVNLNKNEIKKVETELIKKELEEKATQIIEFLNEDIKEIYDYTDECFNLDEAQEILDTIRKLHKLINC